MKDCFDEVFACDSEGYEEYFAKISHIRSSKTDKNQKEMISNCEINGQELSN
ncbi:MAG: hypothetical protein IJ366_04405 [Clostridia bacterium]|nr:hypothetical protein [Clostridia bacterium]